MRRSGKTTRTIDAAIQTLFTEGKIALMPPSIGDRDKYTRAILDIDYHTNPMPIQALLFTKILDRLKSEHHHLFHDDVIRFNRKSLTIKLDTV